MPRWWESDTEVQDQPDVQPDGFPVPPPMNFWEMGQDQDLQTPPPAAPPSTPFAPAIGPVATPRPAPPAPWMQPPVLPEGFRPWSDTEAQELAEERPVPRVPSDSEAQELAMEPRGTPALTRQEQMGANYDLEASGDPPPMQPGDENRWLPPGLDPAVPWQVRKQLGDIFGPPKSEQPEATGLLHDLWNLTQRGTDWLGDTLSPLAAGGALLNAAEQEGGQRLATGEWQMPGVPPFLTQAAGLGMQPTTRQVVAGLVGSAFNGADPKVVEATRGFLATLPADMNPVERLIALGRWEYEHTPTFITGMVEAALDPAQYVVPAAAAEGLGGAAKAGAFAIRNLKPGMVRALRTVSAAAEQVDPLLARVTGDEAGLLEAGRVPEPHPDVRQAIEDYRQGKVTWQNVLAASRERLPAEATAPRPLVGGEPAPWADTVMGQFPDRAAFEARAAQYIKENAPPWPNPNRDLAHVQNMNPEALAQEARTMPLQVVLPSDELFSAGRDAITLSTEPLPAMKAGDTLATAAYPVQNPKVYPNGSQFLQEYTQKGSQLFDELRAQGYDSVYIPQAARQRGQLVALDPEKVSFSNSRTVTPAMANRGSVLRDARWNERGSLQLGEPTKPPEPPLPAQELFSVPSESKGIDFLQAPDIAAVDADVAARQKHWTERWRQPIQGTRAGALAEKFVPGFTQGDAIGVVNNNYDRMTNLAEAWKGYAADYANQAKRAFKFDKDGRILNIKVRGSSSAEPLLDANGNAVDVAVKSQVNPTPSFTEMVNKHTLYEFTPWQQSALSDVLRLQEALDQYETGMGVQKGHIVFPEGSYFHRKVTGIQTLNGPEPLAKPGGLVRRRGATQGFQKELTYLDIEDAQKAGLLYETDPAVAFSERVRQGLQAVMDKWYATQIEQSAIPEAQAGKIAGRFYANGEFWRTPNVPSINKFLDKKVLLPDDVAGRIETFFATPQSGPLENAIQGSNQAINSAITSGHPAVSLVQMLPGLYANPRAWAVASVEGFKAAVVPSAYGGYMTKNRDLLEHLIPSGLAYHGLNLPAEMGTSQLVPRILEKVPILGKLPALYFNRMNLHYTTVLNVLRTEMMKTALQGNPLRRMVVGWWPIVGEAALDRSYPRLASMSKEDLRDLVTVTNAATGTWQGKLTSPERMVAFASRWFRSQLQLVEKAVTGSGAARAEAIQTLGQLFVEGTVLTYLINQMRGYETNFSDPNKPAFWQIHDVGGQNISVLGGPYRDLARAIMEAGRGHPLEASGHLAYGRIGGLAKLLVDQVRGENIIGEPVGGFNPSHWDTYDKQVRNLGNIATGLLPIPIQNVVRASQGKMSWTAVALQAPGLPGTPVSAAATRDELRELRVRAGGYRMYDRDGNDVGPATTYDDLLDRDKHLVDQDPDIQRYKEAAKKKNEESAVDPVAESFTSYDKGVEAAKDAREASLKHAFDDHLSGKLSTRDLNKAWSKVMETYGDKLEQLAQTFPDAVPDERSKYFRAKDLPERTVQPGDAVKAEYYAIKPPEDEFDRQAWKDFYATREQFLKDHEQWRDYILSHQPRFKDEQLNAFDAQREAQLQTLKPYFDTQDAVARLNPKWDAAVRKADGLSGDARLEAQKDADYQDWSAARAKTIERLERTEPDIAAAKADFLGRESLGKKDQNKLDELNKQLEKYQQEVKLADKAGRSTDRLEAAIARQKQLIQRQEAIVKEPWRALIPAPPEPWTPSDRSGDLPVPDTDQTKALLVPLLFPGVRDYGHLSPVEQADVDRYIKRADAYVLTRGWALGLSQYIAADANDSGSIAGRPRLPRIGLLLSKYLPFEPTQKGGPR